MEIYDAVLMVEDRRVVGVERHQPTKSYQNLNEQWRAYSILPGFIDSHNHGGYGIDFMSANDEEFAELIRYFPQEGVTTLIPTVGAMPSAGILRFIEQAKRYMQNQPSDTTHVGGIHLEGPFLNIDKAGLQPEGAIIDPDLAMLHEWLAAAEGIIRIMTIAPELPRAPEAMRCLHEHDIVISAGHSNASTEDMELAIACGCNQVTHLFNGMRGLHHRELGICGVGLCNDAIYAEMAGFDTYSIDPAIWKMIFRVKGPHRIIITTDALTLKGLPDGKYCMMDREVELRDGRLYTPYDGGCMHPGVPMTYIGCVQNMLRYTGATLADIVLMSSVNPAKQCRIFDRKGSLEHGKDADFVVLDESNQLIATYCGGMQVFIAQS